MFVTIVSLIPDTNDEQIAQDVATPAYGPDMANQMQFLDPDLTDKEKLLSTIEHIPNIFQVLDQAAEWYELLARSSKIELFG